MIWPEDKTRWIVWHDGLDEMNRLARWPERDESSGERPQRHESLGGVPQRHRSLGARPQRVELFGTIATR